MNHEQILRSVASLLAVDGEIGTEEIQFLRQTRQRFGMSQGALQIILAEFRQGKGFVRLPVNPSDRQKMLESLIQVAVADGTVDRQEEKVLSAVASKMRFKPEGLKHLIRKKLEQAKDAKSDAMQATPFACPKCGFEQKTGRQDCIRCGIVFARFVATSPPSESAHLTAPREGRSVNYRFWTINDVLVCETSFFAQLVSFFSTRDNIAVDCRKREIRVRRRRWWRLRAEERIPFSQLAEFNPIETKHGGSEWNWRGSSHSQVVYTQELNPRHSIEVRLRNTVGAYPLLTFPDRLPGALGLFLNMVPYLCDVIRALTHEKDLFNDYLDALQSMLKR